MINNKLSQRRLIVLATLACVVSIFIGAIAYFSDRISFSTAAGSVGTLDLAFTDVSSSKTGANRIISPNTSAVDKTWDSGALAVGSNIKPGEFFDLSYTISNAGNKSMDVRQRLVVTSTVPMNDTEGYTLTITGQDYDKTAVAGSLSEDGLSITYDLSDITLNGTGEHAEKEKGITWTKQKYIVQLDFLKDSGVEFQDTEVSVSLDAQAKQHRNTTDLNWSNWNTYKSLFKPFGN